MRTNQVMNLELFEQQLEDLEEVQLSEMDWELLHIQAECLGKAGVVIWKRSHDLSEAKRHAQAPRV